MRYIIIISVSLAIIFVILKIYTKSVSVTPYASPMVGPDFVFGYVKDFIEGSDGISTLKLDNGDWFIDSKRNDYQVQKYSINYTKGKHDRLFISGNHKTGAIDRVAPVEYVKVNEVGDKAKEGRIPVSFVMLQPIYYVSLSLASSSEYLNLLRQNAKDTSTSRHSLMVGIDKLTSEILLVKPNVF